jgi:hypothetical protein
MLDPMSANLLVTLRHQELMEQAAQARAVAAARRARVRNPWWPRLSLRRRWRPARSVEAVCSV